MSDIYTFGVEINVEADTPEEAVVKLWQRMGYEGGWYMPKLEALVNSEDPIHMMAAVAKAAEDLDANNPEACGWEPCCKGQLRFGGIPICQLDEDQLGRMSDLQAELASGGVAADDAEVVE